eukprot:TRINITY_DN6120_c0_g1_i1.p1 TRINITY_DN6120_c0_g1~~TRINITY_DN6120_c0_g1_i1.p1  ORF type:complete len:1325 (-),score=402.73 TRINITY_DN6120_c0_g1_i1:9-3983(-)
MDGERLIQLLTQDFATVTIGVVIGCISIVIFARWYINQRGGKGKNTQKHALQAPIKARKEKSNAMSTREEDRGVEREVELQPTVDVQSREVAAEAQQVVEAEKRKQEEEEAKRKLQEEAEVKRKAEEEKARRKQQAKEAEAKRKEEEAKRIAEEKEAECQQQEARKAEAEAKQKAVEEKAVRKRQQQEAKRKLQEEAEVKRKAEEEEARRKRQAKEAEAKRKEEEEAKRKLQEEAEVKRKAEEEEARRKQQAEEAEAKHKEEKAKHKQQAKEVEAQRVQQELKRKADEEAAELQRQLEAEAQRKADEAAELQRQLEAEAKRRADEEAAELQRKQEEEAKHKADEEAAELKRQLEAEAQRKAHEAAVELQRQLEAEAKRKADEEAAELKRQQEAEQQRKAEEEAAELQRQQEAEAKRKADEEAVELQRHLEAEAKRKAEEEAVEQQRIQEAEAQRRAEEEAAAEAKRIADEKAAELQRQQEAEAKRKADEKAAEIKRQQEAEAKRKAAEEAAELQRQEGEKKRADEEAAVLQHRKAEASRKAYEESELQGQRKADVKRRPICIDGEEAKKMLEAEIRLQEAEFIRHQEAKVDPDSATLLTPRTSQSADPTPTVILTDPANDIVDDTWVHVPAGDDEDSSSADIIALSSEESSPTKTSNQRVDPKTVLTTDFARALHSKVEQIITDSTTDDGTTTDSSSLSEFDLTPLSSFESTPSTPSTLGEGSKKSALKKKLKKKKLALNLKAADVIAATKDKKSRRRALSARTSGRSEGTKPEPRVDSRSLFAALDVPQSPKADITRTISAPHNRLSDNRFTHPSHALSDSSPMTINRPALQRTERRMMFTPKTESSRSYRTRSQTSDSSKKPQKRLSGTPAGAASLARRPSVAEVLLNWEQQIAAKPQLLISIIKVQATVRRMLARKLRQRLQTAHELLDTEKSYLNRLHIVIEKFRQPALRILSTQECSAIFGVIKELANLHYNLCGQLVARITSPRTFQLRGVGELFLKRNDYYELYSKYIFNYEYAIKVVGEVKSSNPAFAKLLQETECTKECEFQDLKALLIEPVQRLPRYSLLLGELLKRSAGLEGTKVYLELEDARNKMRDITDHINDDKKQYESHLFAQYLFELFELKKGQHFSPNEDRVYIKSGTIIARTHWRRAERPRELFLFNDALVLVELQEPEKRKNKRKTIASCRRFLPLAYTPNVVPDIVYKVVEVIPLVTVICVKPSITDDTEFTVQQGSSKRKGTHEFVAQTDILAAEWVAAILSAVRLPPEASQSAANLTSTTMHDLSSSSPAFRGASSGLSHLTSRMAHKVSEVVDNLKEEHKQ